MTLSALHKSLFYVCIYIIHVIYTLLSFSFPFLCTRPPLTSLNLFIFNNYMFCTSCTIFVWFERKQSSSSAETQKHQQKKKTQEDVWYQQNEISKSMQRIPSWNKTWEMFQQLSEEKDTVNETWSMWKRYILTKQK